jgi:hypothetical protein
MENRWKGMMDDMFNPKDLFNDEGINFSEVSIPFKEGDAISIITIHLDNGDNSADLNIAINTLDFEEFVRVLNYNKLSYSVEHVDLG